MLWMVSITEVTCAPELLSTTSESNPLVTRTSWVKRSLGLFVKRFQCVISELESFLVIAFAHRWFLHGRKQYLYNFGGGNLKHRFVCSSFVEVGDRQLRVHQFSEEMERFASEWRSAKRSDLFLGVLTRLMWSKLLLLRLSVPSLLQL